MKVNRNVGMMDRIIRLTAGVSLILTGLLMTKGTASLILIALSVPLLFSALLGFCPSYTLLGLSTRRKDGCC